MKNWTSMSGNITATPEMSKSKTGKDVVNFTVAVNDNYKDKDGNWKRKEGETDFVKVTAWEKKAKEVVGNYNKGDLVKIEGDISPNSYKNKDGEVKSELQMTLRRIELKIAKDKDAPKAEAPKQEQEQTKTNSR
jgi:single-strand DNA-binding protein